MSSATRVWRQTIERATRLRVLSPAAPVPVPVGPPDPAMTRLVRQLFFSSEKRTRILFASVDGESRISHFCERIGKTIATLPDTNVAVVHGVDFGAAEAAEVLPAEHTSARHLAENLWRVPFSVFEAEWKNATAERREFSAFHYLIFGANVSDCATPLFCKACDGAVLVISANHTRREAALRAKEILLSCSAELLGAVLVNRTFPVPELIYRHL